MDKKKIIILSFAVFLLLVGGVFLFRLSQRALWEPKPQLVSVMPQDGATEINLLPEINISFDREVYPDWIKFTSVPSFTPFVLTKTKSTTIKYQPSQPLVKKTTYRVLLQFNFGGESSFSFTTADTEAGATLNWTKNFQEQQKEYLAKYPQEEVEIYNSLIDKMPYFGTNFWIEYFIREEVFAIHLCQEPFEETKVRAKEWFDQQEAGKLQKIKLQTEWLYGCQPPQVPPQVLPSP